MTPSALPPPAVLALAAGGLKGLLTVLGTLCFVGVCFALVELVDRRSTARTGGPRTSTFDAAGPGPDVNLGRWTWDRPRSEHDRATRRQTVIATCGGGAAALVVALLLTPFRTTIGAASVALALVLVIVGAAASGGRIAAAVTSAAAALSFNFLHAAPLHTFHLRNTADVVSSVLMVLVGVAVGEVAVRRFHTAWRGSSAPVGVGR